MTTTTTTAGTAATAGVRVAAATRARQRWLRTARDYERARARLDEVSRDLMAQAERVDVLVRDLWDVPPAYGELLLSASGKLLDSACELAEVRDRLARYERLAG